MEVALVALGIVAVFAVITVIILLRRSEGVQQGPGVEEQIAPLAQQLVVLNTQVENLQDSQGDSARELREALGARTKELRDSVSQETANL